MRQLLTLLIFLCCTAVTRAQLQQQIEDYLAKAPQEKIYIQTDRDYYLAGDTLWFRAHLVDAATNIPSTSPLYPEGRSKFVYIELHDNKADTLVERAMIKRDSMGVFANAIALSEALRTGEYTLVAYTRHMMSYPQELFAKKYITVRAVTRNPLASTGKTRKKEKQDIAEDTTSAQQLSISIAALPEGGNLIAGHRQRLAFKALGSDGYGIDVQVRLVRIGDDEVIAEAQSAHLGMGALFFTPEAGEHYRLEAYAVSGQKCYTPVPDALAVGATLTVEQRKNRLYVTPIVEGIDVSLLSLAVYGGGNVIAVEHLDGKTVAVDTSTMRSGIVNIAIVNTATKQVYAERLAFIYPEKDKTVLKIEE